MESLALSDDMRARGVKRSVTGATPTSLLSDCFFSEGAPQGDKGLSVKDKNKALQVTKNNNNQQSTAQPIYLLTALKQHSTNPQPFLFPFPPSLLPSTPSTPLPPQDASGARFGPSYIDEHLDTMVSLLYQRPIRKRSPTSVVADRRPLHLRVSSGDPLPCLCNIPHPLFVIRYPCL